MADINLSVYGAFPDGATVGAYPASNWHGFVQFPGGASPVGTATDEGTVVEQVVAFTGLTEGVRYYAAEDDPATRYVSFIVGEDQAVGHGATQEDIDDAVAANDAEQLASGKGFVFHDATNSVARPTGYASVEWVGSVEPLNSVDNDTWLDTSA
jgi:hypothetical protein